LDFIFGFLVLGIVRSVISGKMWNEWNVSYHKTHPLVYYAAAMVVFSWIPGCYAQVSSTTVTTELSGESIVQAIYQRNFDPSKWLQFKTALWEAMRILKDRFLKDQAQLNNNQAELNQAQFNQAQLNQAQLHQAQFNNSHQAQLNNEVLDLDLFFMNNGYSPDWVMQLAGLSQDEWSQLPQSQQAFNNWLQQFQYNQQQLQQQYTCQQARARQARQDLIKLLQDERALWNSFSNPTNRVLLSQPEAFIQAMQENPNKIPQKIPQQNIPQLWPDFLESQGFDPQSGRKIPQKNQIHKPSSSDLAHINIMLQHQAGRDDDSDPSEKSEKVQQPQENKVPKVQDDDSLDLNDIQKEARDIANIYGNSSSGPSEHTIVENENEHAKQ